MKYLKLLYLSIGFTLLFIILKDAYIQGIWGLFTRVGWLGLVSVLILYSFAFCSDVVGWQLTLRNLPISFHWLSRLFLVRMVGEAFNRVTPFASMGGEPLKAIMLKNHYQVSYRESWVSLVLAKTIDSIGLVVFLCIGFSLLLESEVLPNSYKIFAGVGLMALSIGIALFILIQQLQFLSTIGQYLSRFRFCKGIKNLLHIIRDTDKQLIRFYSRNRWRFSISVLLSSLNWPLGAVEVFFVMKFLGHPITLKEAWIIESMTQLVRNGLFFIPSSIGTQEGTFLLVVGAITGDRNLGLALSLVRRFREIVWILVGLVFWWGFTFKPALGNRSRC